MLENTPVTKEGAAALEKEFAQLRDVERARITEAIAVARAHGDLKENADYHAAKEQQGLNEARIREIQSTLLIMQIIDINQLEQNGRCVFGTTVTLINIANKKQSRYKIVGKDEADINLNKISCYSPIAKALMGKEEGEEVTVIAPSGNIKYIISKVEYL